MKMDSNTIFITGGGTGIGKGLAEAFHRLGNQVIISGRREDKLKTVCAANPGMRYRVLDVTGAAEVARVAAEVVREFPALNCVINNAGIQKYLDLTTDGGQQIDQDIEEEIAINLLGAIRVLRAFLPQLKRVQGTLINVTSGLAYVPRFHTPVYCATKAAMRSLTMSLRVQLADTGVKVIELVPPRVDTELGDAAPTPYTLPVNTFVDEAMKGLAAGADEVAVGMAKDLMALAGAEAVKQRMMSFGR
jgi:uncharacterized oxidoreductase